MTPYQRELLEARAAREQREEANRHEAVLAYATAAPLTILDRHRHVVAFHRIRGVIHVEIPGKGTHTLREAYLSGLVRL